jgi:hypothetical protein
MSLIHTVSNFKDEALNSVVCPFVIRIGVHAIPAASLLTGEVTVSYLLHYGVILPSPIGIDLLEFPAKMIYILEWKRTIPPLIKTKVSAGKKGKSLIMKAISKVNRIFHSVLYYIAKINQ